MTLEMHYQEKLEEGFEQGLEQGIEQGIEQGEMSEKEKTVLRLIKLSGVSVEDIALVTELPIEKIKEVALEQNLN